MAFGIKIEVWGEFAAFNRPEMKVERVSYDVMTPSAARGILEAIYWKPEMRWVVDELRVLKPIRFTHVRRNEIKSKIPISGASGVRGAMRSGSGMLRFDVSDGDNRQQRAAMILRDVRYGIMAHVEVVDTEDRKSPEAKHLEMFKRRAGKGQCFHHPYLGTREFPAYFELVEEFGAAPNELDGERDLGFMLHDFVFQETGDGTLIESNRGRRVDASPRFFRAVMNDGVITVPPLSDARG